MLGLNLCPHSVSLLKKYTACVGGGQEASYSYSYRNFPAMVAPASSQVKLYYAQRQLTVSHSIFTGKQIAVNLGDVVQFGDRLFAVHGAQNILEGGRLWQIDCFEVTGTELNIQM